MPFRHLPVSAPPTGNSAHMVALFAQSRPRAHGIMAPRPGFGFGDFAAVNWE
jgi:hypothetical protein